MNFPASGSNKTHESKTDPESLLARKGQGKESKLSYSGNLLVENRNGLIVDAEVFQANGTAERDAALLMWRDFGDAAGDGRRRQRDSTRRICGECRNLRVTPHVAQNQDAPAAARSMAAPHGSRLRPRSEKAEADRRMFGWLKTIARLRKVRHRGVGKVHRIFTFACAAYNLVRMRNLAAAVPAA